MSATINRLMDAAESGMRLRGYHAVSFRDLADELGIKSASVHYYFRQKEDLGLALVERYSENFFDSLNEQIKGLSTPKERMAVYCNLYRQALNTSGRMCLCGLLGAESCGLPDRLKRSVAGFFDANINWISKILPASMTAARKKAKAAQVLATLQGALMLATSLQDPKVFDSAVKGLLADLEI